MRVIARPASRRGVYLCARGNECERDLLRSVVYTLVQIYGQRCIARSYLCMRYLCVHEGAFNRSSPRIEIRRSTCGTFASKGR